MTLPGNEELMKMDHAEMTGLMKDLLDYSGEVYKQIENRNRDALKVFGELQKRKKEPWQI